MELSYAIWALFLVCLMNFFTEIIMHIRNDKVYHQNIRGTNRENERLLKINNSLKGKIENLNNFIRENNHVEDAYILTRTGTKYITPDALEKLRDIMEKEEK